MIQKHFKPQTQIAGSGKDIRFKRYRNDLFTNIVTKYYMPFPQSSPNINLFIMKTPVA